MPSSFRRHSTGNSSILATSSLSKHVTHEAQRVSLINSNVALDPAAGSLTDLQWPTTDLKDFVHRDVAWKPAEGLEFEIVHEFVRPHSDVKHRSEETETILLLKSNDKYLLIPESGVKHLPDIQV